MKPKSFNQLLDLISLKGLETISTECRYCGTKVKETMAMYLGWKPGFFVFELVATVLILVLIWKE